MPGGGVALVNAIEALAGVKSEEPDIQTGITIMRRAPEEPMRHFASNVGQNGAVVLDTMRKRS